MEFVKENFLTKLTEAKEYVSQVNMSPRSSALIAGSAVAGFGIIYLGIFEGHHPILVTSDLEIINEVFVKQLYTNFSGRKSPPFSTEDSPQLMMIFASKNRWKRMRNITNPTFSPAKLKELLPLIKLCANRLVQAIEENENKEIDVSNITGLMTFDAVFNCAFGIDLDFQKNQDNIFLTKTKEMLEQINNLGTLFYYLTIFPEFARFFITPFWLMSVLFTKMNTSVGPAFFWLSNRVEEILQERKRKNIPRKDYLQNLFDAQDEEIDSNKDKSVDLRNLEKKLTMEEIKQNVVQFLIGGFDTTSSTLSFSIHILASNPEELKKLQEEIDSNFNDEEEIDYDSLSKLEYLECFVKEVLRHNPIGVSVTNRRCTEATVVKGMKIPKDLVIQADVRSLHFDPQYWGPVDPNEFYPLRFKDPSINKSAFMSFGMGPRSCVGVRFALLEIKMALVKILRKYTIVPGPNTAVTLTYDEGVGIRKAAQPVTAIFKPRFV